MSACLLIGVGSCKPPGSLIPAPEAVSSLESVTRSGVSRKPFWPPIGARSRILPGPVSSRANCPNSGVRGLLSLPKNSYFLRRNQLRLQTRVIGIVRFQAD